MIVSIDTQKLKKIEIMRNTDNTFSITEEFIVEIKDMENNRVDYIVARPVVYKTKFNNNIELDIEPLVISQETDNIEKEMIN